MLNLNINPNEGQLSNSERQVLYDIALTRKNDIVVEIGTWRGGGSTYTIAQALFDDGCGSMLHTIEIDIERYVCASVKYSEGELKNLGENVTLHWGDSIDVLTQLLPVIKQVDILFLDGKEDAGQTYKELTMVDIKMERGGVVLCHDWKESKQNKVKPILLDTKKYTQLFIMDTYTGFSAFEKL